MDINKITFPLYKLRSYLDISTNPLGLVKVTTIKGTYVLDDLSYDGTFEERRLKLLSDFPRDRIYKLKEKILYLRQLIKYKSGTTFIDHNGTIIKYRKGNRLFQVKSHKILKTKNHNNWTILYLSNLEQPFIVGERVRPTITYASVMHTDWGPLLYDLTGQYHEVYRRKL